MPLPVLLPLYLILWLCLEYGAIMLDILAASAVGTFGCGALWRIYTSCGLSAIHTIGALVWNLISNLNIPVTCHVPNIVPSRAHTSNPAEKGEEG